MNFATEDGTAALTVAIEQSSDKCIDCLLEAGAYVTEDSDKTPLMDAAWCVREKCVEKLTQIGVDVNVATKADNLTTLMHLILNGKDNCANYGLRQGMM